MKVDSYAVAASSEREYKKVESSTSVVKAAVAKPPSDTASSFKLELSDVAKKMISEQKRGNPKNLKLLRAKPNRIGSSRTPNNPIDLKLRMLEQLLASITNKRYKAKSHQNSDFSNTSAQLAESLSQGSSPRQFTATLENTSFVYESESISYQATGIVNTSDGKSISLDISMNMSREFYSYNVSQTKINLTDPLVINYAGTAASLTGEKFEFDLDVDGKLDNIAMLTKGSGFLALDKNSDGKINDGSELFGPQSGNGFSELRKYDTDSNGWIDENDSIYSQLRVWSKDADGNDQLFTLQECDVGAIFLGDVSTEFSITNEKNDSYGTMRSTSFFLKESGGSGLVHHIDMSL